MPKCTSVDNFNLLKVHSPKVSLDLNVNMTTRDIILWNTMEDAHISNLPNHVCCCLL